MRFSLIGRSRSGTTISSRIINGHRDLWLTNELWLYEYATNRRRAFCECSTAKQYFKALSKNFVAGRNLPPNFDSTDFYERCIELLVEDTLQSRIEIAESIIYSGDSFKHFGDKAEFVSVLLDLYKENIPIKIIHIHRDGRDVVSSGLRHYRSSRQDVEWHRATPYDNSVYWAAGISEWKKAKKELPETQYIELVFEDYLNNPGLNAEKIADFLEVDKESLVKSELGLISLNSSNVGYYKQWVPNWEKDFCKESIELLKELNYI